MGQSHFKLTGLLSKRIDGIEETIKAQFNVIEKIARCLAETEKEVKAIKAKQDGETSCLDASEQKGTEQERPSEDLGRADSQG